MEIDRKARVRTNSIIDCGPSKDSICKALKKTENHKFQLEIKNMLIPFEKIDTSEKIKETIHFADLTDILKKKFFDLLPDEIDVQEKS